MAPIEVDGQGLLTLARHCEPAIAAPSLSGDGFQPSAAAVDAAHGDVAAAGRWLTARMRATATAASAAAVEYVSTEASAADEIAAIGFTSVTAP